MNPVTQNPSAAVGPRGPLDPLEGRPTDAEKTGPEYVAYLENSLRVHKELLAKSQAALTMIQATHGWRLLSRCYRLRDRYLPPATRRRRAVQSLFQAAVGLNGLVRRLSQRYVVGSWNDYARWVRKNEPGPAELERQRGTRFPREITVSIVTPTYETPAPFLRALLESVRQQTYARWELCVADGGSRSPQVRAILEEAARQDARIKVVFLPQNEGIAGNTAAALALAGGEFVAFLDHDDTLAPFALFEVVKAVHAEPEADVLYSDEDVIDARGGRRTDPQFKPDWSPDALTSRNYICHLAVYRRELVGRVGGVRPGFDGSQDYDLVLRATEQARKVVHVPQVLYHWRQHGGSSAGDVRAKLYAVEAGRKALQEHLNRRGVAGAVANGPVPGVYRTTYAVAGRPLTSIIIPNRDQAAILARCIDSLARTVYDRYEILLVENNSRDPATFAYYRKLGGRPNLRLLTWDRPFNYSAVNNFAAARAQGDVLLFLNNDVEVINADWLERLLEHALRPEVGAVGAKLYYPDDTVQHAGVVLGVGAVAGHVHLGAARGAPGYCCRLLSVQNYSAVTGACLMTRRSVFEELRGFDEDFPLAFNDTDLCMRVRRAGYRIVWTPWAELYHHESATRGHEDTPEKKARFHAEMSRFLLKWGDVVGRGDPFYSPNLSTQDGNFSVRP